MLYTAFFFAIFFFVFGVLFIPMDKKNQVKHRMEHLLGENETNHADLEEKRNKESFRHRVFLPLWMEAKKSLSKRLPSKQAEKLDKQLVQAGNPFHMKSADYRMVQLAFLIGMPLVLLFYGLLLGFQGTSLIIFPFIGSVIGIVLPRYYIKMKMVERKKRASKELPDFVDLLSVSLEAGLGFDSALSKVIGKQDGVLAKEFRRCLEELRLGLTRKEALMGVRDRLDVEEVSSFINSVLRAEKLGVGMVQVLRILTVDVRDRRRQKAEETAMKAPIKILFPLVFFIFPSLFIVILGPVAIQLIHQFNK
ncbi:type II secretion system F family protein [Ectobacillus sp. sgz5001026]|uniref:type II secretion system F family protein n=1 Tax=Ectobacillus sp. sgz5001026 TaxID=3242473 RepID=UPI0036D33ADF